MKGIGAVFFLLLIGVIAMVSVWLFFIFFKVHVTGIAIDVESINRYQEIPTVLLSSTLYEKRKESCSPGDGPAGEHSLNDYLCKKNLAFYYMRSKATNQPIVGDTEETKDFLNNIKVSLPLYCYRIDLKEAEDTQTFIDGKESLNLLRVRGAPTSISCNINQPKINEKYPIPTFSVGGITFIAEQILLIGSSTTTSERSISNWPFYNVEFNFGGS